MRSDSLDASWAGARCLASLQVCEISAPRATLSCAKVLKLPGDGMRACPTCLPPMRPGAHQNLLSLSSAPSTVMPGSSSWRAACSRGASNLAKPCGQTASLRSTPSQTAIGWGDH